MTGVNVIGEQQMNALNEAVARIKDQSLKEIVNVRSFGELAPGDRFKAGIANISPNQVTLRLSSGDMLTARSLVLPDARIGDESIFLVKENFKGQILLEMVRPDEQVMRTNIVREALNGAGLPQTPENLNLAREMLGNGLPLDASSLQKAVFFNYIAPDMTLDKVLFLLKENFPASEDSVATLNNLVSVERGLSAGAADILKRILELPDEPLKALLTETLAAPGHPSRTRERAEREAAANLFVGIKDKNAVSRMRNYHGELVETLGRLMEKLTETARARPETAEFCVEISRRAESLKDNVLFMNHIQQYKTYMQIPFILDGRLGQGELFVWKDGKGAPRERDSVSALIALDTAYIGRVETYITKNGKTLSLQVKGENEKVLSLISRESGRLLSALGEKGYVVSGFALKVLTEPFSVTGDTGADNRREREHKRYSFDMRV